MTMSHFGFEWTADRHMRWRSAFQERPSSVREAAERFTPAALIMDESCYNGSGRSVAPRDVRRVQPSAWLRVHAESSRCFVGNYKP